MTRRGWPLVAQSGVAGVGAAVGSGARFGLGRALVAFEAFPLATLVANLLAAFGIGLLAGRGLSRAQEVFLISGFLGGLSTVSSLTFEVAKFDAGPGVRLAYLCASALGGLGMVLAGRSVRNQWHRRSQKAGAR